MGVTKNYFNAKLKVKIDALTQFYFCSPSRVQIQSVCRRIFKGSPNCRTCSWYSRKQCGKRRKCWLPAFSPIPTLFPKMLIYLSFSKDACTSVRDCLVKNTLLVFIFFGLDTCSNSLNVQTPVSMGVIKHCRPNIRRQ